MPALLTFVVVVAVIGGVLIAATSFVGNRRRTQGRRLDGQVRGFGRR